MGPDKRISKKEKKNDQNDWSCRPLYGSAGKSWPTGWYQPVGFHYQLWEFIKELCFQCVQPIGQISAWGLQIGLQKWFDPAAAMCNRRWPALANVPSAADFHMWTLIRCILHFDAIAVFFYYYYFFFNVGCSQLEFDSCSVCSIQQRATVDFNGLIGRFVECRFPLRLNQVCLAIITNCLSTVRNWIIHEIKPLSRYLTFQSKIGVSVNSNEF